MEWSKEGREMSMSTQVETRKGVLTGTNTFPNVDALSLRIPYSALRV